MNEVYLILFSILYCIALTFILVPIIVLLQILINKIY